MQFNLVIDQILILFLMITVGYIIRKKGLINQEINKGLSNILLDVTLPALVISSFTGIELRSELVTNIRLMTLVGGLIYIIVIIFTSLLSRILSLTGSRETVFKALLIFANVGYMGYPVINAIYPEYGIFYAIISNIFFNLFIFSYGVYIFTADQGTGKFRLKSLLNNGLIAVFIGFLLLLSGFKLPLIVSGALDKLGQMTFPLSMLIIGSSLTNVKFKTFLKDRHLYLLVLLRLLLLPAAGLLILRQFNLPEIISDISILLLAMPAAANIVIFAERYDSDYNFASEGVFITTLLSLFTIPFIIWLLSIY